MVRVFPSAYAQVYRNEAGEVLGWDEPEYPDPGDVTDRWYDVDLDDNVADYYDGEK